MFKINEQQAEAYTLLSRQRLTRSSLRVKSRGNDDDEKTERGAGLRSGLRGVLCDIYHARVQRTIMFSRCSDGWRALRMLYVYVLASIIHDTYASVYGFPCSGEHIKPFKAVKLYFVLCMQSAEKLL